MTRAVPNIFGALTTPSLPNLDSDFTAVTPNVVLACNAAGTNALTLTPLAGTLSQTAYSDKELFSFIALNTSTASVTAQIGALGSINLYKAGGITQAGSGDIVASQYYIIAYQASLNASAGGFVIVSAIPPSATQTPFPALIVQDRKTSGSAGATVANGVFNDRDAQTVVLNTLVSGGGVASPNITLPSGTFDIFATMTAAATTTNSAWYNTRLFNTTSSSVQQDVNANDITSLSTQVKADNNSVTMVIDARFLLAAQAQLRLQTFSSTGASGTSVGGIAVNSGEPEIYLSARFTKVA